MVTTMTTAAGKLHGSLKNQGRLTVPDLSQEPMPCPPCLTKRIAVQSYSRDASLVSGATFQGRLAYLFSPVCYLQFRDRPRQKCHEAEP